MNGQRSTREGFVYILQALEADFAYRNLRAGHHVVGDVDSMNAVISGSIRSVNLRQRVTIFL
jgi:hypothetical protein